MSGPQPPYSPVLLSTLATVVYVATVASFWGIVSLALDRDVVDFPDAGPLLGPAMVAAAGIVVWIMLLRIPLARSPWPRTLAVVPLSLFAMLAVAAVGYGPVAVPHFALGPFVWSAAALAGIAVLAAWALRPHGD